MIHSMTGFGRANVSGKNIKIDCTVRSVNHRFLEINLHMPRQFGALEPRIREIIGEKITRGRLDCYFSIVAPSAETLEVQVDAKMAGQYLDALNQLRKKTKLPDDISLTFLASQNGVISVAEKDADINLITPLLEKSLKKALTGFENMRKIEGQALKNDIKDRCKAIESTISLLEKHIPQIHDFLKSKFKSRVAEMCGAIDLDHGRMEQEISYLVMKMDVSEEMTRLRSHMVQIKSMMDKGGVVGRKIDFLLQEAHREITTCANKMQGKEFSMLTVEIKAELEKIREQIQNVE